MKRTQKMLEQYVGPVVEKTESLQMAAQELQNKTGAICTRLTESEHILTQISEGHQQQLDGHQEQLTGHQEQLTSHQKQLTSHQEELDTVQKQLPACREQLDGHQDQLTSHQEQLDVVQDQLVIHQEQFSGHQDQLTSHQEQLTGHQEQLNNHQQQINDCHAQIQTLRDTLEILLNRKTNDGAALPQSIKYAAMPYFSLRVEGITYFYHCQDMTIPDCMIRSGRNYAKTDIDNFLYLADHNFYRDHIPEQGLFLDIGGNIGTTALYCKLKAKPDLRYIAFEPVQENVRVFRANCAINGVSSDVVVEELALSNEEKGSVSLQFLQSNNFGSSLIVDDTENQENIYQAKALTLDRYLAEHSILQGEIKYIWLDVEGHEPEVLEGASALFAERSIPTCLEFNQGIYLRTNKHQKMVLLLQKYFSSFAVCEQVANGKPDLRPIAEIPLLKDELNGEPCDLILL